MNRLLPWPRRPLLLGALALFATVVAAACHPTDQGPSATSGPTATTSASPPPTKTASVSSTTGSGQPTASPATSAVAAKDAGTTAPTNGPKPYAGPTGTLRGVVHVDGDTAPRQHVRIPRRCAAAAAIYGKLFREGQDRTLADALVTVTEYHGYVPPKSLAKKVTIKDCAYSARTVALTEGQHLEVLNLDGREGYVPRLAGARAAADLVAVPAGSPVKLYPRGLGRYLLDERAGKTFMRAEVLVLKFSTFDVTGLDGRYEIPHIPVGKVRVNAILPGTRIKAFEKRMEIKAGDNQLDITLHFDEKKDAP